MIVKMMIMSTTMPLIRETIIRMRTMTMMT